MVRSAVEADHCHELAMPPGSLFEFTSRFVQADRVDATIALYALLRAIVSIPFAATEDSVKWAKLRWWSEELAADQGAPSRHPILRALHESGAGERLDNVLLQRLVHAALTRIDDTPDCDMNALFERFAALGEPGILLELALDSADIDQQNMRHLAAASELHGYVSSFRGHHQTAVQRLPLNLLAQFNVSVESLKQKPATTELVQITGYLASMAQDWYSKGRQGLKLHGKAGSGPVAAHLQLRWAIENRHLAFISKDPAGFFDKGKRYGPSYAWFAWRFMHRLQRGKKR